MDTHCQERLNAIQAAKERYSYDQKQKACRVSRIHALCHRSMNHTVECVYTHISPTVVTIVWISIHIRRRSVVVSHALHRPPTLPQRSDSRRNPSEPLVAPVRRHRRSTRRSIHSNRPQWHRVHPVIYSRIPKPTRRDHHRCPLCIGRVPRWSYTLPHQCLYGEYSSTIPTSIHMPIHTAVCPSPQL